MNNTDQAIATEVSIFKPSFYNFVIEATDEDYLLYNTKNTGLIQLNRTDGVFVESLNSMDKIVVDDHPEQRALLLDLRKKGFLIDYENDERNELHRVYSLDKETYTKDAADINLTIGTTILCNMGCSYCFEFVKPNKTLKDESIMDDIIAYLRDMMEKSPVRIWRDMNIVWYGGEPLINKKAIDKLSPMLMDLCKEKGIKYQAEIITNGLLLDEETWHKLKKYEVRNVQVTLDGPKEIHDKSRPLLGSGKLGNYDRIMKNLSIMPEGMHLALRINLDKKVFDKFELLLTDLRDNGIWPQRHDDVNIDVAWLRTYEEEKEKTEVTDRFDTDEYYHALMEIKLLKRKVYNEWAETQGRRPAKISWELPELQSECATWVSPYSMVIDPEGNIHKCWETIHDSKESVNNVSEGFRKEDFDRYSDYDRYNTSHEKCTDCKFVPVCDQLSCSHQVVGEKEPPCTYWKFVLEDSLRDQFRFMKNNAEIMGMDNAERTTNKGHSNK